MQDLINNINLLITELWNRCRLEFETRFSITSGDAKKFLSIVETKAQGCFYESDELLYEIRYSINEAFQNDSDEVNDHMEEFFDAIEGTDSFKNVDKIRVTEFLLDVLREMEEETTQTQP